MILGEILRETKLKKYAEQCGICGVCGNELTNAFTAELAHRIPQTESNIRRYGKKVIHHDLNMVLVCSKKCNSSVLINNKPIRKAQLISHILEDLK